MSIYELTLKYLPLELNHNDGDISLFVFRLG